MSVILSMNKFSCVDHLLEMKPCYLFFKMSSRSNEKCERSMFCELKYIIHDSIFFRISFLLQNSFKINTVRLENVWMLFEVLQENVFFHYHICSMFIAVAFVLPQNFDCKSILFAVNSQKYF